MSEENVETIRRGIEAFNQRGIEAVLGFAHPELIAYPFPEWIDQPLYRGQEGWRSLLSGWVESFDEFRWELEKLIDGGDTVVALGLISARIKGTGVPIAQPVGAVYSDFRENETVAEARFYLTWKEALEAAGLSK